MCQQRYDQHLISRVTQCVRMAQITVDNTQCKDPEELGEGC